MKTRLLIFILLLVGVPAMAQDDALPDEILMERTNFAPEGIEYDAEAGHFLVSSLAEGTIFAVADDGTLTPFVEDENLVSSVGLEVDEAGGRLLVANSNFAAAGVGEPAAGVGIFDLETGELIQYVDLLPLAPDEDHFINDLTVDADGNIYATDSSTPVIFKIDPEGEASVFVEDERFSSPRFGLNGIVYHPGGFLLVSNLGAGTLFKIPLDDPTNATEVVIDMAFLADGMVLDAEGRLIAVMSGIVAIAESSDDWATAEIADLATGYNASTATIRNGEVYVVFPHFNAREVDVYEIRRVDFGE